MAMLKTLTLTLIAMGGCFLMLSAGWLLTGRIWKRTSCGRNPHDQNDQKESCPPSGCGLCQRPDGENL